eukprot:457122-Pyramimonas_sp.AAC.1
MDPAVPWGVREAVWNLAHRLHMRWIAVLWFAWWRVGSMRARRRGLEPTRPVAPPSAACCDLWTTKQNTFPFANLCFAS